MAISDIKSDLTTIYSDLIVLSSGSTSFSSSINIKDYDDGVMLILIPISSDTLTNTISLNAIQNSRDDTVWVPVQDEQYIGSISDLQGVEAYTPSLIIPTLGVFGTFQYVRVSLSASGTNTGDSVVQVVWIIKGEIRPDPYDPDNNPAIFDKLLDNDDNDVLDNDDDQVVVVV